MEPNDITPEHIDSSEQIDARTEPTQTEVDTSRAQADLWQQRYVQVSADMQNYKRRMEKEQLTWTRRAQENLLLPLLSIVDDFDRALAEHKKQPEEQNAAAWIVGFEMISKELCKFLKQAQVTPMEHTTLFDPELHEAIAQVESANVAPGDIVDIVQKGYMIGDHVLRPAKVTVAR
jgi:molecular chaperone GrpE